MTARHRALHGTILARAAAETPAPGDLAGWQREGSPEILYARRGRRNPAAALEPDSVAAAVPRRAVVDPATEQTRTEARLLVWVPAGRFSKDAAALAAYGAEPYESSRAFCHALPAPASIGANDWIGALVAMKRFVDLRPDEYRLLQKYLQERAKDAAMPD